MLVRKPAVGVTLWPVFFGITKLSSWAMALPLELIPVQGPYTHNSKDPLDLWESLRTSFNDSPENNILGKEVPG